MLENQPTDLMAMAGLATGAKHPYNMTTARDRERQGVPEAAEAERAEARRRRTREVVRALTDESAWLTIENIGTDARVEDARRPA